MNIPELVHSVGSTERVHAAHINDLNDFYLQRHIDLEPLSNLCEDLYNEYSQTLTRRLTNFQQLDVDHYCACPSESHDWYRGLIRQIDSGEALVYRIDYGDIQRIPLEYLRPLKEKFFKPPRLAFNCSLSNLRKPIDGWSEKIIEEFKESLTKTFLFAQITNYNPIRCLCEVDLIERTSKTSFNKDFNRYQQADSLFPINDPMIYQKIQMEPLEYNEPFKVNILYYISPNRFYVYLPEKLEEYRDFHNELQRSMQIIVESPELVQYNCVAARDQHLIWHRAILLEIFEDSPFVIVYFVDLGYREFVSIENLQSIPIEYLCPAAMAIPCRLFRTFPLNQTDGAKWSLDDPIHGEFHRLTTNLMECVVMNVKPNVFYDVSIFIPKIGDLCNFLCDQKLASSSSMYSQNDSRQPTRPYVGESRLATAQLSAGGVPPKASNVQPPSLSSYRQNVASSNVSSPNRPTNAPLLDPPGLPAPKISSTNEVTSKIQTISPSNGPYIITQVHSATEFYGYAVKRENELKTLQKILEDDCNAKGNDSISNCSLFIPGEAFAIQTDNKYERVVLKKRDSDSKVRVKFIDRGGETVLDTSELLPLDPKLQAVPGFAQPFRLKGYDETRNSQMVTKNLKQLILNKTVQITLISTEPVGGSYVVDVNINGKSLSDLPLTDNNVASMIPSAPAPSQATTTAGAPPTSNISRSFSQANSQNTGPIGSQVYTNTTRYSMSSGPTQAPPQRASAPMNPGNPSGGPSSRGQPGRFGIDQSASSTSRLNEQSSQQPPRLNASSSQQNVTTPWNRDNQSNSNNRNNFEGPHGSNYPQNSVSNSSQRNNDNNSSTESKRPFGNFGNSRDSQYDQTNRTNNFFSQNNRGFGSSRLNSQNSNDNERSGGGPSNSASSDGFSRQTRGFSNRGHPDQGSDRSSFNRQDSRDGFSNSRGYGDQGSDRSSFNRQDSRDGFSNSQGRRDPPSGGGTGELSRRYDDNNNRRDFQPRGEYSDRGGRGGRGGGGGGGRGRGGFDNRNQGEFRSSFDNNESSGGFRKPLQTTSSTTPAVPVGKSFPQNIPPRDSFEYVVSNIEEVDDFHIQLIAHEDEISTINNVLQREFGQCPIFDVTALKMDQACLALSTDGCWYRAVIISTSGIQPKVRFVDFGDSAVVTGQGIRHIAEKHCSKAPYALRCTLADIIVSPDANINKIIDQCFQKKLQGKIVGQTADKRFILQSDQIQKIFIDTNAIKKKPSIQLPRHSCSIAQIEADDHEFYIQDDKKTVDKISEIVENEWENSATLSIEEIGNLSSDAIIMALFEEVPYRAMIRQEENENDVKVYFVDYGNTDISAKTSLKRCSDELSKYPSQAKRCQLFGISSTKLADAFASLEEKSELESIEFSIVKENNQIFNVLIYIDNQCFNEQFGCDLSTIAEEEKSEILQTTTMETTEVKEEKEEIESIVSTTSKTHRGLFTHMETERPYVYIQLLPGSEEKLEKINEIIDRTTANPKAISEGHAGDLVIARFTDDETYYRARIQSFSAESNSYSVYFIDFGNIDENVASEFVLSYPDELKTIEPQVRGYLLDQIDDKRWHRVVRPFLETEKLNSEVNFDLIDEQSSIIHLHDLPEGEGKGDDEDVQAEENDAPVDEQRQILSGYVSSVENDCFYFQSISSGIDEMNDVLKTVARQNRTDGQWAIGDRCLVVDDDDCLSRGEIVSIEENNEFIVKSFDYGSTKTNRKENQLFLIPDEEIFQREPLAHQCRLQSVDDEHQREKIEEIPSKQLVQIEIENDQNASCWCVKIRRDEQIEQQSNAEEDEVNETLNSITEEHPNEFNSCSVISNNQTIDFGEADQPTTIQDETQNEPVPSSST